MSYIQRKRDTESPFSQTYNTATWNVSTSPNTTTSPNWMTSNGNGYSFTGNGYVFGFIQPSSGNSIAGLGIGSSNPAYYTRGMLLDNSGSTLGAMNDDMCINYSNNTKHYHFNQYFGSAPSYTASSRFNVIRMEL